MSDRPARTTKAAKKTAAKKAPVKKTVAKKAPAKKAAARKAPVKKAAATKAPVKRATATRARTAPVKKAPVKSTPSEISVATDAASASGSGTPRRRLKNISEVRHFFRTNDVPIMFFGATPFNLLGIDRWVRHFSYVTYYDAWDGAHPRVFTPNVQPGGQEFDHLRGDRQFAASDTRRSAHRIEADPRGIRPKIAMVFFDERDREDLRRTRIRADPAARRLREASRLQDHDDAVRQRGGRTERAERADQGEGLGRFACRRG